MIRVVVGGAYAAQNLSSEKVLGSPRFARPDHFLQKDFAAPEDIDWQEINSEAMLALAQTQTLFGESLAFRFSDALSGERGEAFLKIAKELVASPHLFFFEEEKLLKGPTVALEKVGAKIEVHKPPVKKERAFDAFGVTAALAARDRKALWLGVVRAEAAGEKAEATAGILVWKVRQMLTGSPSPKWARSDLAKVSRQLVALYHDSHRGAGDLGLLLEKFALTL